jgi:hypothetical protein
MLIHGIAWAVIGLRCTAAAQDARQPIVGQEHEPSRGAGR